MKRLLFVDLMPFLRITSSKPFNNEIIASIDRQRLEIQILFYIIKSSVHSSFRWNGFMHVSTRFYLIHNTKVIELIWKILCDFGVHSLA